MRRQIQFEDLYGIGLKRKLLYAGAVVLATSTLMGLGKFGYNALTKIISEPRVPNVGLPSHDGIPFGLISRTSVISLEGHVTDVDLFGSRFPASEGRLSFVLDNKDLIVTPYDFNCDGNAKIEPINGIYATLESAMSTSENVKVVLIEDDKETRLESVKFPCRNRSWGN